jgi:APA family basic amino acid/polyamine antiporter
MGKESLWLPEESFQSFPNYKRALFATPERLKDRFLARTNVEEEIEIKRRSGAAMKRTLTWWDLMWFGVGAVIGAGIFVLTGQEANGVAGPAIIISYALAGISAMLSVFCYTEFAVEIPVAGGSFAYLRVELGDFIAFIGAGNIVLEYIVGGAAVARGWTSYFATLINKDPTQLRILTSLHTGYNQLDPIAVVILFLTGAVAIWSTKGTSVLNYIATVVNMFIIAFIIIAGLAHAKAENYRPFLPYGVRGIFSAASVLFFAYLGFDAVSTMAEETKNPGRDIPIGLLGSMTICTILYVLMALTLCLMVPTPAIDTNAPFPVAFKTVGMNWAQYLVSLGALKGITTVILVSAVGQARYLTHIARSHLIPPWFGIVNKRTKTPANATVTMITASAILAFFTALDILGNLLSLSSLFIFFLVAVGILMRRYYIPGVTTRKHGVLFFFFLFIIIAASVAISAYWGLSPNGWILYAVFSPIWFLGTLGLAVFVPQVRTPQIWGVPLVPWVPSLSIALNIFLLGTLDKLSFERFGIWTAAILVYYFLFGLHASYDTAINQKKELAAYKIKDAEEGQNAKTIELAEQDETNRIPASEPVEQLG